VNLRQGEVNLNQGVIRTLGKGDRERLVPLGEVAMHCSGSSRAAPALRSWAVTRPITCSPRSAAIA
jgi:site-specific recombinase XerC